ncbi:MAG: hypothetical protein Q9163_004505 [Psora crenata]
MGITNRKGGTETAVPLDQPSSSLDREKQEFGGRSSDESKARPIFDDMRDPHTRLHRGLKARQVTMIAIGGAIGTGLIIGTGSALAKAGPASLLISYTIVGFVVYMVMCALGEMAAWLPLESGFTGVCAVSLSLISSQFRSRPPLLTPIKYAARFCDPALGFSVGYTYWFKYVIVTPNQLTAASLVIQYWVDRDKVNPGVFITVFLVAIIALNYLGIKFFGEFEFWLSSIKVLTICGLIILSLVLMLGGGPDGDRKGFRYWNDPGAFKPLYKSVTVGEAQNPRKVIPRAIKLTFWRIVVFYVLSVLLVGTLVPYNSKTLSFATKQTTGASASPFVVAIIESGISVLPGFLDLYIATRTLYGLAKEGNAHRIFARTDRRGLPVYALGLSALICCIAFLNVTDDSRKVFLYFVNLVTIFGLLTWISILVTHISFVRARRAQGIEKHMMAYTAPFGLYGTYFALVFCIFIAVFKNFDVFVHDPTRDDPNFDYKNFITGYLGIPLFLIMIFGYKWIKKTKGWTPLTADFYTGKDIIDQEEAEFLAKKEARGGASRGGWFYRKFIAWLL